MNRDNPDYEKEQERARELAERRAKAQVELEAAHNEHHARLEKANGLRESAHAKAARMEEEARALRESSNRIHQSAIDESNKQFHADKARIRKKWKVGE